MSDEVKPESHANPSSRPGAKLAEAREQQGKSREQIASALNIQLSKIVALEADQYEKLFSPVFTRGYLRSYGKYLGLDGEALVREFEANFVPAEEPLTPSESLNVKMTSRRSVWPARLGLVVMLLLLLSFLFWYFDSKQAVADEQVSESAVSTQSFAEAEPSANSATDYTPAIETASAAREAADDTQGEADPVESTRAEFDAASDAQPAAIVSDMSIGTTSSADGTVLDELVINFDSECWLEVLDANGDSLAADLQRQGTSITLHGVAPFNVKLGNPDGVEIALNGSDVSVPDAVAGTDKVVRFDVNTET